MRYTTRLYAGFASIVLLVLILIVSVVSVLNNQNHEASNLVEDRYEKIKLLNHVRVKLNHADKGLNEYINTQNNRGYQRVKDSVKMIREDSVLLKGIINRNEAKELLADIDSELIAYETIIEQVHSYMVVKDPMQASALYETAKEQSNHIITLTEDLINIQENVMEETLDSMKASYDLYVKIGLSSIVLAILLGFGISQWVIRNITTRFQTVRNVMQSIQYGSESLPRIQVLAKDEIGEIAQAYNEMAEALEKHEGIERRYTEEIEDQNWLSTKLAELSLLLQESVDLKNLGDKYLQEVVPMVEAHYGGIYLIENDEVNPYLSKISSYADAEEQQSSWRERIGFGEGLIGQCAKDGKPNYIHNLPPDYISISSGSGKTEANSLLIYPIDFNGEVIAVLEMATLHHFTLLHEKFLEQAMNQLGIAIYRISQQMQVRELLEESQALNEELQSQSEELQLQQEELRTINEELEAQYKHSEQKTRDLEGAKQELEEKTKQVELSSKYKSEFLANMSHELRTPLNSMIILAQILHENKEDNLTGKQKEYASTIYAAGRDLLYLINDILDLAKIESGKASFQASEMDIREILDLTIKQFEPLAIQKGIKFKTVIANKIPNIIYTDQQKVFQILKNLLSNAIKFTEKGKVELMVNYGSSSKADGDFISFHVSDTGIGISAENRQLIFEAFQQEDGTTSRKYGGTGLGLSISKELAQLLGGYIQIESKIGKGSTFTFYLPVHYKEGNEVAYHEVAISSEEIKNEPVTEHQSIGNGKGEEALAGKKVLVVDDDMRNIFSLTTALENVGMNVYFAENGREGLEFLEGNDGIDIVLMDIMMPEMDGYEAMKLIRQQERYKELPIIALTAKAMGHDRSKCIDAGASDYITKPVKLEQLYSLLKVWLHK